NGWNDFEYNMASGANSCGVCYWLLPAKISTFSRGMAWESYASIQRLFDGGAPLKNFVGNYCSSAMMSFSTIGPIDPCDGLAELSPVEASAPPPDDSTYYPQVTGARIPSLCEGTCFSNDGQHCDKDDQCKATPHECKEGKCTNNQNFACQTDDQC